MTLPEYELTGHCHHGREVDTCTTDECSILLLEAERQYSVDRASHAAETGEHPGWNT